MASFATGMDPKIAQGFAILSQSLFPDPLKRVQASVLGARRELYDAQSQKTWAERAVINADMESRNELASILSDPNAGATPEGRARQAAAAARQSGYLAAGANGPKALVGTNTFVNPQAFSTQDLSTVLAGTGANYANTPTGFAQDQQRTMDQALGVQRLKNESDAALQTQRDQAEMDRLKYQTENTPQGGQLKNPAVVNGRILKDMTDLVLTRLAQRGGNDPGKFNLDPALKEKILADATANYQRTKNMEQAVQEAIDNADFVEEPGGWLWGRPGAKLNPAAAPAPRGAGAPAANPLPPGPLPASGGAQAATPPVQAPAPAAQSMEGRTATGRNGQKIVFTKGQWVDVKTGVPVQ